MPTLCFMSNIILLRGFAVEKQKKNIAGTVWDLAEPVAESLGLELWDVEYVKEGADMVLRITIDKDSGVDINDCEAMHRAIDPVLDEADPIEVSYRLEVSSPGVERTLSRPKHFESSVGQRVEVKLYAPLNGQKKLVGVLTGADSGSFTVENDSGSYTLEKSSAAKVSTLFDWNEA